MDVQLRLIIVWAIFWLVGKTKQFINWCHLVSAEVDVFLELIYFAKWKELLCEFTMNQILSSILAEKSFVSGTKSCKQFLCFLALHGRPLCGVLVPIIGEQSFLFVVWAKAIDKSEHGIKLQLVNQQITGLHFCNFLTECFPSDRNSGLQFTMQMFMREKTNFKKVCKFLHCICPQFMIGMKLIYFLLSCLSIWKIWEVILGMLERLHWRSKCAVWHVSYRGWFGWKRKIFLVCCPLLCLISSLSELNWPGFEYFVSTRAGHSICVRIFSSLPQNHQWTG